jgi:phenylalanyl-tRNA synthetase alpha chain
MIDVKQSLQDLEKVANLEQLESFFQQYLGKNGSITLGFKQMGSLSPEEKKTLGQELTEARNQVTEAYEAKQKTLNIDQINTKLNADIVDFSLETADGDR